MSQAGSLVRGFAGLIQRLDAEGVAYVRAADAPQLTLGDPDGAAIRLSWLSGPGRFEARFRLNARVPPERVSALAITIARINASLNVPGFGLDAERGEIDFRVVHLLERDRVPYATLQDILTTVVQTAQRHAVELLEAAQPSAPAQSPTGEDPPWWGEE